ncbi:hypothetical protein C6497_15355 [Candidatus Poribacteria bacterium]|nr:MAG: hypothetical protein C6497_15355 [Candidatus Poribacteria bacterium]
MTIFKAISYWLWVIFICIVSLFLCTIPLFNILGFEFCAVITICITFAGAHVAMIQLHAMLMNPGNLQGSSSQFILRWFYNTLKSNILLLIIPLIIILLNSLRIKNCNYTDGFFYFFTLPFISCLIVSAAGIFFNVLIQKRGLAYLAYLGFLILSCIPVVINLIFHPPVFAYHPIIGYFPGPIYDFLITISPAYYISRIIGVLWGVVFLYITITTCEVSRITDFIPKLNVRKLFWIESDHLHIGKTGICLSLLVLVICAEVFSGHFGIRPTRDDISKELGGYRETRHFEIIYARELELEIDQFSEDCEFRYKQLSEYLKTEISRKVRVYLYSTPEQKKKLIGAGSTYVEDPFGYGFHVHTQGFPHPVIKHELAHVLTSDWSPWKVSLNVGVHEGVAVAADWSEEGLSVHQWVKAMHHLKVAPPLDSVMGLGFWRHAGSRSYLLAGSFIRFLIDSYGLEKLKSSFPIGNLESVYEKDIKSLETEWKQFLSNNIHLTEYDIKYAERRLMRGGIFEQVCAHEMAAQRSKAWRAYFSKDYHTAVDTFYKMLDDERSNPRTMVGLMYSAYMKGDIPLTISIAKKIVNDMNSYYKIEATQLLGDIHWSKGESQQALQLYNSVVDEHLPYLRQINIHKRIAALSNSITSKSQERLRDILTLKSNSSIGNGSKTAILLQIIESESEEWFPYILVGELLHKEKSWELSTQYLLYGLSLNQTIETKPIPNQLKLYSQILTGKNTFQLNDFENAENRFTEILEDRNLSLGTVLNIEDWIERCEWMMNK